MNRILTSEWLDELPADSREAVDSRRDLRRLNAFLRHPSFVADSLLASFPGGAPEQVVELGAGDGVFALRMASRLAKRWPRGRVVLVDRRPAANDALQGDFDRIGWAVEIVTADVFDWLEQNDAEAAVANLFLHHFEGARLERLLRLMAKKAAAAVACEPRRSLLPFCLTHLLGLAGCNAVTRHDAPISVQAGFRGNELTALWPKSDWKVAEREVGLFSHLLVARRC